MSLLESKVILPHLWEDGSVTEEEWLITDCQSVVQEKGKSVLDIYTLTNLGIGRSLRLSSRELELNSQRTKS